MANRKITDNEWEKIFEEMFGEIDVEFILMQLMGVYPMFLSIKTTRKELEEMFDGIDEDGWKID